MPQIQQSPELTLEQIQQLVGGTLRGDPQAKIVGVCPLDEQRPNCITFTDKKGLRAISDAIDSLTTTALIVRDHIPLDSLRTRQNILAVKHPLGAMVLLAKALHPFWHQQPGVNPKADVHPTAKLGQNISIGAFCSVGENAVIEDGVVLHPHVTIYPAAVIGKGAVIHSGAVIREESKIGAGAVIQNGAIIGADGFGYFPTPQGLQAVPQIGIVELSAGVDIGANSCIDRATFGTTKIGVNTKIDNLVQVGHNTRIGSNSIVCGMSGISGSCNIGDRVTLGGGVGVADHTTIEDDAIFGARSGVIPRTYKKDTYAGFPAIPLQQWRKEHALLRRLPEMYSKLSGESEVEVAIGESHSEAELKETVNR